MLNRILTILLMLLFIAGGYVAYTAVTLPNVKRALESGVEPSQTSQVLARDHSVVMSYGKFQHKALSLSQIPPTLVDALLATEDRRFYEHKGIDPIGILRAIVQDIRTHGASEGGSTITQQLARNIFLTNERSIQRKVKEALLAIKLEQQLNKDQILELYLNNIYLGEGAYGVGAASLIYFGKPASQLTTAECALIAGLPQAPSLYDPFSNPELAIKRRNEVLDNMVKAGKLTHVEAKGLKQKPLHLNPQGRSMASADRAPFFDHYVVQEVLSNLNIDEQTFWQQDLKVYTTLDPRAQMIADEEVRTLSRAFGRTRPKQEAALLSLDQNGGMIAYVGGKDYSISQFDRVSQAHRLAGSLFKVFVYTTAIAKGFTPQTVYKDAPVTFGNWSPENYDKGHHGYMSLAQALCQSNNIVAVKVLHDLGPEAVIQTAQSMGIQSPLAPNLSLALGAVDVSLKEMTGAFSILQNDGFYASPYAIEKIVDRDGNILYQHQPDKRLVLQRSVRDTMVKLMEGVVRFGTGRAAILDRPVAGKTGTSDDYRDAWFIGYTPEITTGVWVGNDDNTQMPGITGGSIPARIWHAYMERVLRGIPKSDFDLSNAMPIEDKDFFVYNIRNLSPSEGKADDSDEGIGNIQTTNVPQDGAGNTLVPGNQGGVPADSEAPPGQQQYSNVPNNQAPQAPIAPQAPGNTNDRFFNFRSSPTERFVPNTASPPVYGSPGAPPGHAGQHVLPPDPTSSDSQSDQNN